MAEAGQEAGGTASAKMGGSGLAGGKALVWKRWGPIRPPGKGKATGPDKF